MIVPADRRIPLPPIGLGTHGIAPGAIAAGLRAGYRLIDTATSYGNEQQVGAELRASGVDREEIKVITKLAGPDHGFREAFSACRASLRRLGLSYIDLYLIHWPNPHRDRYVATWRAMIELRELGLVRAIGVSNFAEHHLEKLITQSGEIPAVNQVELHPGWRQDALRATHVELGIATMAWSPLGDLAAAGPHPAIAEVAERRGWTAAQATLRWHAALGVVPVPRSSNPARLAENLAADGVLRDTDLALIARVPQVRLWGADPDVFRDE